MRKYIPALLFILTSTLTGHLCAQAIFNKIDLGENTGGMTGIVQDRLGYIWFTAQGKGLVKYDGAKFTPYTHNDKDSNSISGTRVETLTVDSSGNVWIGTNGDGMDMFDRSTNVFKHFRYHANDPGSISHDTVDAILEDHLG